MSLARAICKHDEYVTCRKCLRRLERGIFLSQKEPDFTCERCSRECDDHSYEPLCPDCWHEENDDD